MSVRNLIKTSLNASGLYSVRRWIAGPKSRRLIILMYHDFTPEVDALPINRLMTGQPTAHDFEAHLQVITNHWRPMLLADAVAELDATGTLAEDTVAVTIDDGYSSVATIAAPLLTKYNVPATVFLITDWIDGNCELWWLDLARLMMNRDWSTTRPAELARILPVDLVDRIPPYRNGDRWQRVTFGIIDEFLRDLPDETIARILNRLDNVLPQPESAISRDVCSEPLSWEQIRALPDLISLAPHTACHSNLSWLPPESGMETINASRERIRQQTGRVDPGFAYPYGNDVDGYRTYGSHLAKNDYQYAVVGRPGPSFPETDRFLLGRTTLSATTHHALIERELSLNLLKSCR